MATDTKRMGPVRRVNLTAQLIESLKAYMVENNLTPGSRLPTEKELTARFGVSRNILREALKSLQAVGLIEIRVGDGTYVKDFDYSTIMSHISSVLARKRQDLKHFIEARLVVEVGALELVVAGIKDEDIARLEEIAARYYSAPTQEEGIELDLVFHRSLLEIARNPILTEFGSFLVKFFMEAHFFIGGPHSRPQTSSSHRELIAALKARDVRRARETMRSHIMTWDWKYKT
jgi:GntR family transcriptional regulator, transcriptional repressor for pyruvate dehydrogenase complex